MLDRRLAAAGAERLLEGAGEILQHDHGFGAGILELMLELGRACRAD